ncbi:MAG: hypothetical protein V3S30_09195, partial [Thermoanaerobaculia bacterium]
GTDEISSDPSEGSTALTIKGGALLAAVVLGLLALIGATVWNLKPNEEAEPVLRKFKLSHGSVTDIALSPDARHLALIKDEALWIRSFDRLDVVEVPGTAGAQSPFWSPDSNWVAFSKESALWKMSIDQRKPSIISELPSDIGAAGSGGWGSDGRIVLATGFSGILEVSAQGGDVSPLLAVDSETEEDLHDANLLPNGRGVLFVIHPQGVADSFGAIGLLTGSGRRVLINVEGQRIRRPVYSPSGHLLYRREPTNAGIWAVPFSLADLKVTGEPFLVVSDGGRASIATDGSLAYISSPVGNPPTQLISVDRRGGDLSIIGDPGSLRPFPALSPNGREVAVAEGLGNYRDIWIYDLERSTKRRLTFEPGGDDYPAWSPDGKQIVYRSRDDSGAEWISLRSASGEGGIEGLTEGSGPSFSRDGKTVLFTRIRGSGELWFTATDGSTQPTAFLQGGGFYVRARLSPVGRYVAYVSSNEEQADRQVYLKRFPSGEGKWQVSMDGGDSPRWNGDGDELFYLNGDEVMAVKIETEPSLAVGTPQRLFTRKSSGIRLSFRRFDGFDVAADGQRFIFVQKAESAGDGGQDESQIVIVQNWYQEFEN